MDWGPDFTIEYIAAAVQVTAGSFVGYLAAFGGISVGLWLVSRVMRIIIGAFRVPVTSSRRRGRDLFSGQAERDHYVSSALESLDVRRLGRLRLDHVLTGGPSPLAPGSPRGLSRGLRFGRSGGDEALTAKQKAYRRQSGRLALRELEVDIAADMDEAGIGKDGSYKARGLPLLPGRPTWRD